MKVKTKILYVEDDPTLRFITCENLERAGYHVHCAEDGLEGMESFLENKPDICLLDVMLPKLDGFNLAIKIRNHSQHVPILFLTAKSMKEDRIEGLVLGADDYIVKPFSVEELILKIEVFVRRSKVDVTLTPDHSLSFGHFRLDIKNLSLYQNNSVQKLTQREAELLELLVIHKNKLLTREKILETIWGENDYFFGRSLDVFISKLRKYLQSDSHLVIENRHGVGFLLRESAK